MQFADGSWAHGGPKVTSRTTDADAVVDLSAESGQTGARESAAQLRDVLTAQYLHRVGRHAGARTGRHPPEGW